MRLISASRALLEAIPLPPALASRSLFRAVPLSLLGLLGAALAIGAPAQAADAGAELARALVSVQEALRDVEPADGSILLDRGIPLARPERFSGSPDATPARAADLRQIALDLARAARPGELLGDPARLLERGHRAAVGPLPIAIVDVRTSRIPKGAIETGAVRVRDGRIEVRGPEAFERARIVAAAPLADRTWRGAATDFVISESWLLTSEGRPTLIEIDFDDGAGFRPIRLGERNTIRWATTGPKMLRVRLTTVSGEILHARSGFDVRTLAAPAPHDTLAITASESWLGSAGTGDAYVYLAPGHADITDPVIVLEGFDVEDSMFWEELYELLNQENLIEDLRSDGFDAIVLNFTQATDPIPRNGFVAVELIEQVKARIDPSQDVFVVGASMGGLVGRWALGWMEQQGLDHRTRTFLTLDAPHDGANIPLGIQYWLDFFSGLSGEAEFLLGRLDTPAARQLLVLHHTTPPDGTPDADPLRAQFLADLAAVGDWPALPRTVAVANGTGSRLSQGFVPAAQIIDYDYESFLVDILGNVWATPSPGGSAKIFDGKIDYLIGSDEFLQVFVDPPKAWDDAPGGWRGTMAEMDSVEAPFGDIVALHSNHCFVPTTSSLALDTQDLWYDVAGDPNLLAITPVDAVYFPTGANQEHVSIDAESAAWFRLEIGAGPVETPGVRPVSAQALEITPPFPNPSRRGATIRFSTPLAGSARVEVHDVTGRLVATLLNGPVADGTHELRWGEHAAAGVYFVRLQAAGRTSTARLVVTD